MALDATGETIRFADQTIDRVNLRGNVAGPLQAPAGSLNLTASRSGQDLELAADYALEGKRLRLAKLELTGPQSRLGGDADLDLERTLVAGRLSGAVGDLAALSAWHQQKLTGAVDLAAVLATPARQAGRRPQADGSRRCRRLRSPAAGEHHRRRSRRAGPAHGRCRRHPQRLRPARPGGEGSLAQRQRATERSRSPHQRRRHPGAAAVRPPCRRSGCGPGRAQEPRDRDPWRQARRPAHRPREPRPPQPRPRRARSRPARPQGRARPDRGQAALRERPRRG